MTDLLFDLQARLNGVRQKERLVTWVAGLSRLCLWLLMLLTFYFIVDIWIVRSLEAPESYLLRVPLTLVVLALVAWRAHLALVKPLGRTLDDDLMALRVENAHPELRHRLISTLQLGRAAEADALVGSPELVAALEEETITFTRAIEFPDVVRFKPAWDWLWKALVCLLMATGLCLAFPRHASAFFLRLMFLDRDYPTRMTLTKIDCVNVNGDVVLDEDAYAQLSAAGGKAPFNPPVAAGDAAHLRVFPALDAELPFDDEGRFADGTLTYQYTDGPNAGVDHELALVVPKELAKAGAELIRGGKGPHSGAAEWATFRHGLYWQASLDAVTDPFRATAELDDGRIAWRRFNVLPRPVVRMIKLTITPPGYTPLSPETHDKTGDVAAMQGSMVKVELQSTQRLLHAQLQFADPAPGQTVPQVIKLKPAAGDGSEETTKADTVWTGTFEVDRNTSYFIDLRALNGLTHPANPPVYQVVAKIDPLPTIQVQFPKADDTVTLKAVYPVKFSAHDNFGIKGLRLRYKVGDEDTDKVTTIDILAPSKDNPDRALKTDIEGDLPLEIIKLSDNNGRVAEGEVVTFWLEAQDACPTDRPMGLTPGLSDSAYTKNWARSNLYRLAIVTVQEKETELRQKVQEQLDLIHQQADTIKKDRNERVVPAIEGKVGP